MIDIFTIVVVLTGVFGLGVSVGGTVFGSVSEKEMFDRLVVSRTKHNSEQQARRQLHREIGKAAAEIRHNPVKPQSSSKTPAKPE